MTSEICQIWLIYTFEKTFTPRLTVTKRENFCLNQIASAYGAPGASDHTISNRDDNLINKRDNNRTFKNRFWTKSSYEFRTEIRLKIHYHV